MADENNIGATPAAPLKDAAISNAPNPSDTAPKSETVTFTPSSTLETETGTDEGPAAVTFEADDAATVDATKPNFSAQGLKDQASKLGAQAADRARGLVGEGKTRATDALDEFSRLMQDAAGSVDDKLGEQYGQYARSAAEQISGLAENLRGKEVDELIDDVSAFVKKSPAVAAGVAAALGFVVARLVKSGIDAAPAGEGATKA